jgi:hypothetical protein
VRVEKAAAKYRDNPLVANILDFIHTAKRPLTTAIRRNDSGELS